MIYIEQRASINLLNIQATIIIKLDLKNLMSTSNNYFSNRFKLKLTHPSFFTYPYSKIEKIQQMDLVTYMQIWDRFSAKKRQILNPKKSIFRMKVKNDSYQCKTNDSKAQTFSTFRKEQCQNKRFKRKNVLKSPLKGEIVQRLGNSDVFQRIEKEKKEIHTNCFSQRQYTTDELQQLRRKHIADEEMLEIGVDVDLDQVNNLLVRGEIREEIVRDGPSGEGSESGSESESQNGSQESGQNSGFYLTGQDLFIPPRVERPVVPVVQIKTSFNPVERENWIFRGEEGLSFETRQEVLEESYPERDVSGELIEYTEYLDSGLRIVSINCGHNVQDFNHQGEKKDFKDTDKTSHIKQIVRTIIGFMKKKYDFILLQEACDLEFKQELLLAIMQFNQDQNEKYFFPENLKKKISSLRITSILTRHQAKLGQFRFKIFGYNGDQSKRRNLPDQAYCELKMKINNVWKKVCIFSYHLKSSRGSSGDENSSIRMKQVEAIYEFSRKFDIFIAAGDSNIPSILKFGQENRFVSQRFADGIQHSRSQFRGTYLYVNRARAIVPQRIDRVWQNWESFEQTSITIKYIDQLLDSCQHLQVNGTALLELVGDRHVYKTVTDHSIMDIHVLFTR